MKALVKVGLAVVLVTTVCATSIILAETPVDPGGVTTVNPGKIPSLINTDIPAKQPPPPATPSKLPTKTPNKLPGQTPSKLPSQTLGLDTKFTCTANMPGCRPPEVGGTGGKQPPDCNDVGPNEPC